MGIHEAKSLIWPTCGTTSLSARGLIIQFNLAKHQFRKPVAITKRKISPRRICPRARRHLSIKEIKHAGEFHMAKTFNITLAFLFFAPIAFAIAMQAAHIVA